MRQTKGWMCALAVLLCAGSSVFALRPGGHAVEERVRGAGEMISSPGTLIGEAVIRTDGQGRLTIVLDEAGGGALPDGRADRLFLFQGAAPILEPIDLRLPLVSLVFAGTSLHLTVPGSPFTLDLAVSTPTDRSRRIEPETIVLHDGIALASRRLRGQGIGDVDADRFVIVQESTGEVQSEEMSCDGGGEGSKKCTYKCSMGVVPVTKSDECSVECGEGYYSCCGCSVFYDARCQCKKEKVETSKLEWEIDRR